MAYHRVFVESERPDTVIRDAYDLGARAFTVYIALDHDRETRLLFARAETALNFKVDQLWGAVASGLSFAWI
jgi:hypothetical protein